MGPSIAVSAVLFVQLDGFGVEPAGGVGTLVGVDEGGEFAVDGFEGCLVVLGDGGAHEVAVALFAGPAGGETFSCGPCCLLRVFGLERELCEPVGGVVDGDDGVGEDAFGVGPAVTVFDPAEGGSFDDFETSL